MSVKQTAGRNQLGKFAEMNDDVLYGDVAVTPGSHPCDGGIADGAAPDSWFSHLAIEVSGENSRNE